MGKEIRWSLEAVERFEDIIQYLKENWTDAEIANFVSSTDRVVKFISRHPKMFRKVYKSNIHEALVTEHNLLIYKILPTHIDILTFWDTRQHPRKKKL